MNYVINRIVDFQPIKAVGKLNFFKRMFEVCLLLSDRDKNYPNLTVS